MAISFELPGIELGTTLFPRVPVVESIHRLTSPSAVEHNEFEDVDDAVSPAAFEAVAEVPGGLVDVAEPIHPLATALTYAYCDHLPIRLTPDQIWVVIAQGFARHVNLHAEQLRERFVRHEGKATLRVRRDDFVRGAPNPWPEVFESFDEQLREHLGKRAELVVSNFSTTGPLERTVSQLVLMDAMQSYFSYEFISLCGIPRVTLTGTPDDWRSIRTRARVLREYELGWWVDALEPILDHFVAAAEGRVDEDHWAAIYKLNEGSGGPFLSGWFHLLFPYLAKPGARPRPNPHIDLWREGMNSDFGGGPTTEEFPSGLSSVPMRWQYRTETLDMELLGGFIGVDQDPDTLELSPKLGWAVRERVC